MHTTSNETDIEKPAKNKTILSCCDIVQATNYAALISESGNRNKEEARSTS